MTCQNFYHSIWRKSSSLQHILLRGTIRNVKYYIMPVIGKMYPKRVPFGHPPFFLMASSHSDDIFYIFLSFPFGLKGIFVPCIDIMPAIAIG